MTKQGSRFRAGLRRTVSALAFAGLVMLSYSPATMAQSKDVKCKKCVGASDIAKNAIKNNRLKDNAVSTSKIRNGAVTSAKILDGTVTGADIANGTIGQLDIGTGGVASSEVLDDSLTGADVLDGSIGAADLGAGAVGASEIATGAVGASEVLDNSLTALDLGDEAGADFLAGSNFALLGADETVLSISITAPSDGVVIVFAQGTFRNSAKGDADCSITTGTTQDDANEIGVYTDKAESVPFNSSRGFNVSAGTTTFNFVCSLQNNTVSIEDPEMQAIYVPTQY
jgi:hypothetical protein